MYPAVFPTGCPDQSVFVRGKGSAGGYGQGRGGSSPGAGCTASADDDVLQHDKGLSAWFYPEIFR